MIMTSITQFSLQFEVPRIIVNRPVWSAKHALYTIVFTGISTPVVEMIQGSAQTQHTSDEADNHKS